MADPLTAIPTKTVRFSQVVDAAGSPEPYTLWTAPEKDPEFQRALKTNRVMRVHQETTGSKKDFGIVGYIKDASAQLLIFPKSLKRFEDRRVIGLKYDLLKEGAEGADSGKTAAPAVRKRREEYPVYIKPPSHPTEIDSDRRPAEAPPASPSRAAKKSRSAPRPAAPEEHPVASSGSGKSGSDSHDALLREVKKALKELQQGKAVAAYQRLEKAAASAES